MSTSTLAARAGNTLRAFFLYTNGENIAVSTDGWTARLQIRAITPHDKVLSTIFADDPDDVNLRLSKIQEGRWELILPDREISTFPSVCRWELELVNDENPRDSIFIRSGMLTVTPAIVK